MLCPPGPHMSLLLTQVLSNADSRASATVCLMCMTGSVLRAVQFHVMSALLATETVGLASRWLLHISYFNLIFNRQRTPEPYVHEDHMAYVRMFFV